MSEHPPQPSLPTTTKYRLAGTVQRIGFRRYLKRHADELGITGYATNETDGSLIVLMSSPDATALGKFQTLMHQGPPGARIIATAELVLDPQDTPPPPEFETR